MTSVSRLVVCLLVAVSFSTFRLQGETDESGEPNVKPGERISTKVQIPGHALSVPLKPAQEQRLVNVSFPTKLGKKYLVFVSKDLRAWTVRGDPVDGTGNTATVTYNSAVEPINFIRIDEVVVTPIPNMVWVPAGSFMMGSPVTEQDRDLDEDPVTDVTLTRGFWMGKHEVTQREYQEITGTNPSWFQGDPNRPVEQVSWKEAVAYCARLTERERLAGHLPRSYAYRLPTEAEFEYAARAGTSTRFSFGDDPDYSKVNDYAWHFGNSGGKTQPVGRKLPNAFGLHDIYGNVFEWCLDWYADRYAAGPVRDPLGPTNGFTRVLRGGSWDYPAQYCRSAYRNNVTPGRRSRSFGFRVVLSPLLQ